MLHQLVYSFVNKSLDIKGISRLSVKSRNRYPLLFGTLQKQDRDTTENKQKTGKKVSPLVNIILIPYHVNIAWILPIYLFKFLNLFYKTRVVNQNFNC